MALVGNEILYVDGISASGLPAATLTPTTTQAIANLSAGATVGRANTNISTAGAGTLTGASIVGGVITRTGPSGAFTDTTATAAQIYAAAGNVAGISFFVSVRNTTAFVETIAAGSGVTLTGNAVVNANSVATYLVTIASSSATTMYFVNEAPLNVVQPIKYSSGTTTTTFTAGQLTGAARVVYTNTGATPGTIATRTATEMLADLPSTGYVGQTWDLVIVNGQGTGTLTVGAGSGVTLTGTATIAANTWRAFAVNVTATGTPAITLQNYAVGTFS